jgi:hypothetical protein
MDMRCTACQTDNTADVSRCAACGESLAEAAPAPVKPRSSGGRRGVAEEADTPFGPLGTGPNRAALIAFRVAVVGLVPGLGLVLGPLAVLLGWRAWRRGRGDAAFTAQSPAVAAVLLGAVLTLTNWVGLALMIAGWHSGAP